MLLTFVLNRCSPVNIDIDNIFNTSTADQKTYDLNTSLFKFNRSIALFAILLGIDFIFAEFLYTRCLKKLHIYGKRIAWLIEIARRLALLLTGDYYIVDSFIINSSG